MNTRNAPQGGARRRVVEVAVVALMIAGLSAVPARSTVAPSGVAPGAVAAAVDVAVGDGSSPAAAAASCWEIKQEDPAAPDGAYWLVTPTLGAPQQFYCDQTTDGGGWVLVGRGREGWWSTNAGRGAARDIWETPTGVGAFAPRQLPTDTVMGLLDGGRVDALADGVRLRRATTPDGSSWQEVRFSYETTREDWSWQFVGLQRIASWRVDSATGTGGTTGSFGSGSALARIDTGADVNRGWSRGFGFGSAARGAPGSTSFVYASSTTQGYPKPFTQVFLRPQLSSADLFAPLPDEGAPASTRSDAPESHPLTNPWGVSGLGAAGSGELNTEVAAFAEIDGVVYVGGNFRYVQRNAGGTDRVEQSYLAAFDAESGQWLPGFRPALNNQVKALAALPGGRLAVGGAFTRANGADAAAFVVVDPTTGETDDTMVTRVVNYQGGTPPLVRALDLAGEHLYLGGRFTHVSGGGSTREVYLRNIGRIDVSDGAPDDAWAPTLDGTVVDLDASDRGDRTYAAGYFGLSNWDTPALRAGAFSTADATVIPWQVDFSNTSGGRIGYQQAVEEVGDRVWLGGAEHMLFSYERDTMTEASTNITQNGGDFQAISEVGGDVAAGCHCSENVYQGARQWPGIAGFHRTEHINQTGLWDAADGAFLPSYGPVMSMREGSGTWAIHEGADGTLWVGGDFTHARAITTQNLWTGGFARFAARDVQPPATPDGLTVTADGTSDTVAWDPVGGGGTVSYQVLRTDRVVATTSQTQVELPPAPAGTRYFVRAADQAGNVSATTAAAWLDEAPEPEPEPVRVLDEGSSWRYWFAASAPAPGWQAADYDDAGWPTGTAPLGWGHAGLGTVLEAPAPRPLTSYYRAEFEVAEPAEVATLLLTTRADDGIVVYVNGLEVSRTHMPAGQIGHGSYATTSVRASDAVAHPVLIEVPVSLLEAGRNVVAAEVHANYRATPSVSFELSADVTGTG